MPNFLVLDNFTGAGGTACAAYQYVNATPTQLGNTFGSYLTGGSKQFGVGTPNGLVQFQGDLYAFAQDGVYRKDDPTVTTGGWTQQIALTTPGGASWGGLHPIEVGGVLNLVGVYQEATANRWRWVKFDGTTWTQAAGNQIVTGPSLWIKSTQVYRGVLYMAGPGGGNVPEILAFDPSSESFSNIVDPYGAANFVVSLCVFDDRLFAVGTDGSLGQTNLSELIGGAMATVDPDITGTGNVGSFHQHTMWALFTDGTYMYALTGQISGAGDIGWHCTRIDSGLTTTNISAEVLPGALISTNDGGSGFNTTNARFQAIYDTDTDPANPVIYLAYTANGTAGTSVTLYRWNYDPIANPPPDPANQISSVDIGGDTQHGFPVNEPQGGCRIFTPGELDVKIVSRQGVVGGEEITFRAYGGGTGHSFKMFYKIPGDIVLQEATLTTPVTGGSATFNGGLNRVEGVAADGTTDYTIVWDIATDSIAPSTIVDRVPQITV